MLLDKLVLSVFKINATLQSYIFKSDLNNTLGHFEYQLIICFVLMQSALLSLNTWLLF